MKRKANNGFTLIELVVVMAIVAIVGTMLVVIFTSTLRGSNKSQVLSGIKQGGQAVLEDMDKTFRSAENIVCPITTSLIPVTSTGIVIESAGVYTRYRFIAPLPLPPALPTTNGLIQKDNPVKATIAGILETDSGFISRVCNITDPMPQAAVLTDTNLQTGISVTNGLFIRNKQPGFKDSIKVEFTLGPAVKAPAVIVGQIDPVIFQTTVELR